MAFQQIWQSQFQRLWRNVHGRLRVVTPLQTSPIGRRANKKKAYMRLCIYCPGHHDELISRAEELGRDLLSLLERMDVTKPGEYEGPVFNQLYNWLSDPNHTVDGLKNAEGTFWQKEFNNEGYPGICLGGLTIEVSLYLWFIAIEALAARKPILQGPWECAAWLLVKFRKTFRYWMDNNNKNRLISNRLNIWIIHIMGNCELCPNPYLRLEFMDIFGDFGIVYPFRELQAFDAVMFSCWPLKREQMKEYLYNVDNNASLRSIKVSFNRFTANYLQNYDHKLCSKLLSQASLMIHDVSCSYGFHQNRETGTFEVNILTSLFQTISMHVLNILKNTQEFIYHSYIYNTIHTLTTVVTAFRKSCETPQLIDVTGTCIMDVVEMTFVYNISFFNHLGKLDDGSLSATENMLWALCDTNSDRKVIESPVGRALNYKYERRLSNLRHKVKEEELDIVAYPMIWNILYHN